MKIEIYASIIIAGVVICESIIAGRRENDAILEIVVGGIICDCIVVGVPEEDSHIVEYSGIIFGLQIQERRNVKW